MNPETPTPVTPPVIPTPEPVVTSPPVSQSNTSGMGDQSVVPEEVKGWSWGGFLWSWIWAIGNNTWIGLLALVPFGNAIMPFILGIYGREWAWKNKKWESIESFKKVQKNWALWWLLVPVILALFGIFFGGLLIAINPAAQVQRALDSTMAANVIELNSATERYYVTNKMFPWNTTANDSLTSYMSSDVLKEDWLPKLVSSGDLTQKIVDNLTTDGYPVKVYLAKYSNGDTKVNMHFCFQPKSPVTITRAKASCDATTDQNLKDQFCLPGSEYLCFPDLVPQTSPTP